MAQHIKYMENEVLAERIAPGTAADILLDKFIDIIR